MACQSCYIFTHIYIYIYTRISHVFRVCFVGRGGDVFVLLLFFRGGGGGGRGCCLFISSCFSLFDRGGFSCFPLLTGFCPFPFLGTPFFQWIK